MSDTPEILMLRVFQDMSINTVQETPIDWQHARLRATTLDNIRLASSEEGRKQINLGKEGYFVPYPRLEIPYTQAPHGTSRLYVGYGETSRREIFLFARSLSIRRAVGNLALGHWRDLLAVQIGVSEAKVSELSLDEVASLHSPEFQTF